MASDDITRLPRDWSAVLVGCADDLSDPLYAPLVADRLRRAAAAIGGER
jgi:hypothetical protein